MKLFNLHEGDIFRFAKGFKKYIITSCVYTDEVGYLIDFIDIKSGQLYQYQEISTKKYIERTVIKTGHEDRLISHKISWVGEAIFYPQIENQVAMLYHITIKKAIIKG